MDANTKTAADDILLKDEVHQLVGAAIEVLNTLGHGLHEKPYENALVVEFQRLVLSEHSHQFASIRGSIDSSSLLFYP